MSCGVEGCTQVETWRDVPGFDGAYQISSIGNHRSVDRRVVDSRGRERRVRGRKLRLVVATQRGGYLLAQMNSSGHKVTEYAHRLVLEAFVGECPEGLEARHLDSRPTHNCLANLEWATRKVNIGDQLIRGTQASARKTCCPRRHPLVAPNLVAAAARRGTRVCLACSRAHAFMKHRRDAGVGLSFDFQTVADRYYAEICASKKAA